MTYRRGFTSKRFLSRTDIDQQALPYVDHDALIDENMDNEFSCCNVCKFEVAEHNGKIVVNMIDNDNNICKKIKTKMLYSDLNNQETENNTHEQ
jgi:hypothetical protein